MTDFSWGDTTHTCLITPNREPMTDQSMGIIKVQLGEAMSLTEVSYRNTGKRLLTGAQMIQRQLYPQGPLQHGDSSQSWGPREHCTSCRQLHSLESALSRCPNGLNLSRQLGWFLLLSGSWACWIVFCAA